MLGEKLGIVNKRILKQSKSRGANVIVRSNNSVNSRKARAQAAHGKSASPNFLEVVFDNFPVCFTLEQLRVACQKNAVARRASFAEGVEGGEKPQSSPSADGEIPTEGRSA